MALIYFIAVILAWALTANYLELKLKKSKAFSQLVGIGTAIIVVLMLPPLAAEKRLLRLKVMAQKTFRCMHGQSAKVRLKHN